MSLLCSCPAPTEIPDITSDDCVERIGEVQKIVFQRTKDGTTLNEITIATSNPNLLATWTALKAASDNTKVTVSPFIQGPESDPGEPREFGGEGQTLGGIPILLGSSPTSFTAQLIDVKQLVVQDLKEYMCERELSVFLVDEHGRIWGLADDPSSATTFRGIPIRGFFVSDKNLGGFTEPDRNEIRWSFLPNWSDNLYSVTPSDFEALVEL